MICNSVTDSGLLSVNAMLVILVSGRACMADNLVEILAAVSVIAIETILILPNTVPEFPAITFAAVSIIAMETTRLLLNNNPA